MAKSYYEILEVVSKASEAEIRKAYRTKMREFHPDLNPEKAKAHKRSRELNVALEVLTNPAKRKRYDEKLQRLGKEKANAEFDFTGNQNQSTDHDMPEFDFNTKDNEPKSKKPKSKAIHSVWMILSLATAGISAVCVSLMFLWVFFRSDPTGLIAAETQDLNGQSSTHVKLLANKIKELESNFERAGEPGPSAQEVSFLKTELEMLRTKITATGNRLEEALASQRLVSGVGIGGSSESLPGKQIVTLEENQTLKGPPRKFEPIELSICPPAGRHLILATVMAYTENRGDTRVVVTDGADPVSSWFFLALDDVGRASGTVTIPVAIETDGSKNYRVEAWRFDSDQRTIVHAGSSLQFIPLTGDSAILSRLSKVEALLSTAKADQYLGHCDLILDHNPGKDLPGGVGHELVLDKQLTWQQAIERYEWFDFQVDTSTHNNGMRIHRDMLITGETIEVAKFADRYVNIQLDDLKSGRLIVFPMKVDLDRIQIRGIRSTSKPEAKLGSDAPFKTEVELNDEVVAKLAREMLNDNWQIEWMDTKPITSRHVDFDANTKKDDISTKIWKFVPREVKLVPSIEFGGSIYVYDAGENAWLGFFRSQDRKEMRAMKLSRR